MSMFKKGMIVEHPIAGFRMVRNPADGTQVLSKVEAARREALRQALEDPEQFKNIRTAVLDLLNSMSFDEMIALYPDDTDEIADVAASILRESLTDALLIAERPHPSEQLEKFEQFMTRVERVIRQMSVFSPVGKAEIIAAAHEGSLLELLNLQAKVDDHEKLLSDVQKKLLFTVVKEAKALESLIKGKSEEDRLTAEETTLAFLKTIRDAKGVSSALKMMATGAPSGDDKK